ncbi:TPA: alanyl-tRNA editing protein [Candidatus Woesearchaeota archaeon]|nr:alanyl-tRNA editing protein [Candidatus Woesearchaeota archaeon]
MKSALYLTDSYLQEFDAEVVSAADAPSGKDENIPKNGNKSVVLNQTCFYPNSGGQLNDVGTLIRIRDGKIFNVVFAAKTHSENPNDVKISHEMNDPNNPANNPGKDSDCLKVGDKVHGKIDWQRRNALQRYHTASHVLSTVINNETGALITGNQLETEKAKIDFSLKDFDREKMAEYVRKANEVIDKNLPVKIYFLPREEAMRIPGIVKLAAALPPAVDELRIVQIGEAGSGKDGTPFDVQADGGTHVKTLSEIGHLELIKLENKGAERRRIYFRLVM